MTRCRDLRMTPGKREGERLRAGKVAGVQVILNNWFLGMLGLFMLAGMGGKVLGVFGAVLWHELAHAVTATTLGYRVREMELLPFGGVARIDRLGEAGAASDLVMAAAGPAASLVLAAAIYFGLPYFPEWAEDLNFYLTVNMTLAFFNLLPALPLDGGRIARALLTNRMSYGRATKIVVRLGNLISAGLVAAAGVEFWQSSSVNLTFLFAAVFLYVAARGELQIAGFRSMRILAQKKAELSARGVMPTIHYTALPGASARDIVRLFGPEQYHIIVVVNDAFRVERALTETEIWEGLPERGLNATLGEFL